MYAYGSSNPFPNSTFSATNYLVDVVFTPGTSRPSRPPASVTGTPQEGSALTAVNGTTSDPSANISGYQWQSSEQRRHHLVEHRRRHRLEVHPWSRRTRPICCGSCKKPRPIAPPRRAVPPTKRPPPACSPTSLWPPPPRSAARQPSARRRPRSKAGSTTATPPSRATNGSSSSNAGSSWSNMKWRHQLEVHSGRRGSRKRTAGDRDRHHADGGPSKTSNSPATARFGASRAAASSLRPPPGDHYGHNDPNAVDGRVKFQASTTGTITGIRFIRGRKIPAPIPAICGAAR